MGYEDEDKGYLYYENQIEDLDKKLKYYKKLYWITTIAWVITEILRLIIK